MHHIAILDDVLLTLKTHLAGLLGTMLALVHKVVLKANDLGTNKTALKVGVNHASSLRRSGPYAYRPGPYLFGPRSEIGL